MPIDIRSLLPNSFPSQNTHRLMVVTAEAQPDEFSRLEATTADALAAAREALAAAEEAQIEDRQFLSTIDRLSGLVEKGRILGGVSIAQIGDALRHLDRLSGQVPVNQTDRIRSQLAEAAKLSRRVSDLLAAEREVGWHRRLGRDK